MRKFLISFIILLATPFVSFAQTAEVVPDLKPAVTSTTHPSESGWYPSNDLEISWDRPEGAYGFSFELDRDEDTIPDNVLDTTITQRRSYPDLEDGVWYFHIKARRQTQGQWGEVVHFKVQIDSVAPAGLTVNLQKENNATDNYQLVFAASDSGSGIGRYDLKIDDGPVEQDISSPYVLDGLAAGNHNFSVAVYDKAGNSISHQISGTVPEPARQSGKLMRLLVRDIELPLYIFLLGSGFVLLVLISSLVALRRKKTVSKEKVERIFDVSSEDAPDTSDDSPGETRLTPVAEEETPPPDSQTSVQVIKKLRRPAPTKPRINRPVVRRPRKPKGDIIPPDESQISA